MGEQTTHPLVHVFLGCDDGVYSIGGWSVQSRVLSKELLAFLAMAIDIFPAGGGAVSEGIGCNSNNVSVFVVETCDHRMLLALDIPEEVDHRSDGSQLGAGVTAQRVQEQRVNDPAREISDQL